MKQKSTWNQYNEKVKTTYVTASEMKNLDRNTIEGHGIPSLVLMERAALAALEVLDAEHFDLTRTICLVGPGNNGGDGLALSRLLLMRGVDVRAFFIGNPEKRSEETLRQWDICRSYHLPIETYEDLPGNPTTVIDALFGIGINRQPAGAFIEAIRYINQVGAASARVLALDVASGIITDTGEAPGDAVRADVTVALAYKKPCHAISPGKELSGKIIVKDIGIY
jgi:NAD(P)H-hydrate epimerase